MLFNLFNKNKMKQQHHDNVYGYVLPPGTGLLGGGIYDGEQDIGAMGNEIVYDVDYYSMAQRAYTLAITNEFVRIAVTRLCQFVIGTGLKLYPTPLKRFIEKYFKVTLDVEFAKDIQELWSLFEDDKNVSSDKLDNIHGIAKSIFYNAFIAGDVLVIKRVKNGNLEYQVINGLSVKNITSQVLAKGNKIIDGVEIDENGKHVQYFVIDKDGKEQKIAARDSKDRLVAWLVYADDKRLGAVRGYSPLGAIMQKLRNIGKYTNSEVIAANTNSKFAAFVKHDKESSGANPFKGLPGFARGIQEHLAENNDSEQAQENATEKRTFLEKIKKFTAGIIMNLPKGQSIESIDTKRPNVNCTQFVDGSMKYNNAALGIPHEIALLVFQSNFSASRAALKMFEMILRYYRKFIIVDQFYQEVYKQFFEIGCLKNYINAPKYLTLKNDNGYLDNAYTKAKFVGAQIPHIDETKEVNAVLAKIKGGLSTFEQGLESLGCTTDFDTLIETRKAEQDKIDKSGLTFETIITTEVNIINNNEGDHQ